MLENNVGLGTFLSEVAQSEEKDLQEEKIVYIEIENLESNPKNFYGLRDVDTLAGLISVSHLVEPLTVSAKDDGKYTIISGHRRRAAVQKLLEDGVYNERKLPCIVKDCRKISIEQENGEIVEFDEDAVEMLNLIASNRGQREERTIDEKLQEVRYLEKFAKAIYNQKDRGKRGRFRNFFAEEILNISATQLQRIHSMDNLTEEVKQALNDKKISETAASEISTMTEEEQKVCLEKILAGEVKGTVRDIQIYKSSKDEMPEESQETSVEEISNMTEESVTEEKSVSESEKNSEENKNIVKSEMKLTYPKKLLPTSEKNLVSKIIDVPEEFGDPQKEAEEWIYLEKLAFYENIYEEAKRLSEEEENELKAAQWGIRASVTRYNIEELKLQHNS